MWSLGCLTVVLLTGGSPFVNPETNQYCQKLAHECNLQQLECVVEWQFIGKRPKDFVRQLLLLDEEQRMGPGDAKRHCWFSNDFHRLDFEAVYNRATKHWRPRMLKTPVIDLINAHDLMEVSMQQKSEFGQRSSRRRTHVPIDPPYKPYPRRMSFLLRSKQRPSRSGVMSDEVRIAIRESWSTEKMRDRAQGPEEETVPILVPDGLPQRSQTRNNPASIEKSNGDERIAPTTNPGTAEGEAPRCGDDTIVLGEVDFNQRSEDVAVPRSTDLALQNADEELRKIAGEKSLNVRASRQKPFTSALSSCEDPDFLAFTHAKPFAYKATEVSGRKSGVTKLRRPLRGLNMKFKQTSNSKRRRGSIYDIESDEETELAHCRLSMSTLNPDSESVRTGTAWKKARTSVQSESIETLKGANRT